MKKTILYAAIATGIIIVIGLLNNVTSEMYYCQEDLKMKLVYQINLLIYRIQEQFLKLKYR